MQGATTAVACVSGSRISPTCRGRPALLLQILSAGCLLAAVLPAVGVASSTPTTAACAAAVPSTCFGNLSLDELGEPVNPPEVMARCQYGSLPGGWLSAPNFTEWAQDAANGGLAADWDNKPFGEPHPMLPHSKDFKTAPFGSMRQTWDPACQTRNLIAQYLSGSKASTPPRESVRVLTFGDSTDAFMLHFLVQHLHRVLGGNITKAFKAVFANASLVFHDKLADFGPQAPLNRMVTTAGLILFQKFITELRNREETVKRVADARRQYTEVMGKGSEPHIIVVHNLHWALQYLARDDAHKHVFSSGNMLPPAYVASYMRDLAFLAQEVRKAFPGVLITTHTAAMPRFDPHFAKSADVGRRVWMDTRFVAQLNDAIRMASRALRMPLVDWDGVTHGLLPKWYTYDDIHVSDWCLFEFFNMVLNLADDDIKARVS
ncbi:hypothetical protein FOA52_005877 [Chlamydomonas sp. UWO 241]|nr:hypothetical protein FOA52_005877 [Chlamydomonas sp. UWO 241]